VKCRFRVRLLIRVRRLESAVADARAAEGDHSEVGAREALRQPQGRQLRDRAAQRVADAHDAVRGAAPTQRQHHLPRSRNAPSIFKTSSENCKSVGFLRVGCAVRENPPQGTQVFREADHEHPRSVSHRAMMCDDRHGVGMVPIVNARSASQHSLLRGLLASQRSTAGFCWQQGLRVAGL